jgi:hypothetical protein
VAIALALPAWAVPAGVTTTTTLTAQPNSTVTQYKETAACTLTTLSVNVADPADSTVKPTGTVTIWDATPDPAIELATTTLDDSGNANFSFALENGTHSLSAAYAGVLGSFVGSTSPATAVTVSSQCSSTFVMTVSNPLPGSANTMTLTPGQAGMATVTVTPLQVAVPSTAPLFVTISCSGLSDMANCNFTPENVEITPGQYAGVSSDMVLQTYAASSQSVTPTPVTGRSFAPIVWAFLLPGIGLGGLAFGARRRRWLSRLSLVALVSLVTLLGTTGCNPLWYYQHHPPGPNPPTPAGTYTVLVTAQSSNNVAAITHSAAMTLTVQ